MKDNPRFQITSKQLTFTIIGCTIATGFLSIPRAATADAGQDGWIAIILGAILPLLSLILIERLGRYFPDLTIIEMVQLLFGKFLGSFLAVIFIAYIIFLESIVLRLNAELVSAYILPKTPIWMIALLFILCIVYIAQKGGKVVGRLNELLFYILLIACMLFLPTWRLTDYTNILPVGGAGLLAIAKGVIPTAYAYQGIEILFVVYPMVTRKDKVLKAGLTALGIIMPLYLIITVLTLLVNGSEALQKVIWPAVVLFKVVDIPVLERLEFFFMFLWILVIVRPVFTFGFAGAFSLAQLLKLNIEKYYSIMVTIIGASIYVAALLPENITKVYQISNYGGYGFFVIGLGYPILFHLVAFIRKGKVRANA